MWCNDKDDVLLGNTFREVVGPDVLADNFISSNFSNDGDKLSDWNEYINLNQGPNPDMGLNYQ